MSPPPKTRRCSCSSWPRSRFCSTATRARRTSSSDHPSPIGDAGRPPISIGFFLSTVALRTRLEGDLTGARSPAAGPPDRARGTRAPGCLVRSRRRSGQAAASARAAPGVPGDVRVPARERSGARVHPRRRRASATHTSRRERRSSTSTLFAAESGDEMETILEYRTDLFDRETMHRMLAPLRRSFSRASRAIPDQRISAARVPHRRGARAAVRALAGRATGTRPTSARRRAGGGPRRSGAGCRCRRRRRTHTDLSVSSHAHRIRSHGSSSGSAPGEAGRSRISWTARPSRSPRILGILKAGAAYVPIDPDYPEGRHRFIVRDSGIDTAVTTSALLPRIAGLVRNTVLADAADARDTRTMRVHRCPIAMRSRTAYVIYTSGSTGDPKGVVVSDRNLLHSTRRASATTANRRRVFS